MNIEDTVFVLSTAVVRLALFFPPAPSSNHWRYDSISRRPALDYLRPNAKLGRRSECCGLSICGSRHRDLGREAASL